ISYDREVGEETDELSASVDITMHIFSISAKVKNDIIKYMLQSNTDPSTLDLENSQFQFDYKDKNLLLTGTSLPKINTTNLAKKLVLKNPNKITETLKSESTRVYDFNLQSKPAIFKNFPILPARSDMIYLEIKTEE
ncbi:hypothetical protein KKA02_03355, partial [Patescibacteria group bacterium]|nr:hypothetical protein [Patescibacteria group bacterium]